MLISAPHEAPGGVGVAMILGLSIIVASLLPALALWELRVQA